MCVRDEEEECCSMHEHACTRHVVVESNSNSTRDAKSALSAEHMCQGCIGEAQQCTCQIVEACRVHEYVCTRQVIVESSEHSDSTGVQEMHDQQSTCVREAEEEFCSAHVR